MQARCLRILLTAGLAIGVLLTSDSGHAMAGPAASRFRAVSFKATTGAFTVSFRSSSGAILIHRKGKASQLAIRELSGGKKLDLLSSARAVHRSGSTYTLTGKAPWASFTITVGLSPRVPGLLHLRVVLTKRKPTPAAQSLLPDVRLLHAPAGSLKEYAAAPPVAGSSVYLSSKAMGSSLFYLADFTSLGPYFDRTESGVTQGVFPYPNAGDKGSLVGVGSNGYFGYVQPPGSLDNLPNGKATVAVDSYLYLLPTIPSGAAATAETYLKLLGTVYSVLPHQSLPSADWPDLATMAATALSDPSNWVTVNGQRYLRSYVSDARSAPELITQASVLAGVKAYESRFHQSLPLDAALEQSLPSFYDSQFHTVTNGLPHSDDATGESWYFVQNMISLLQLSQLGSQTARTLLLDSADALVAFAHANNYAFPISFRYRDWTGQGSGLQPDVAGGYAWLMLGLHDLTGQTRYLDEAKASMAHVAGRGFSLSYETQMTAYTAAAAERLFKISSDSAYETDVHLALANLFHATRLWDCTYGLCLKGSGYHTYFGLNPLPWSDYTAMREQYEAWLALRDYRSFAQSEPSYVTDLVDGFLTNSPRALQYALPPLLPQGAASPTAGEYSFVPKNNLGWYLPLEDLREGDSTSGTIGQEIYGAGGPFIFAAYG
jgi:hypothetical protein